MATAAGPEDYKQQYELLLVEKKQLEGDFGQKRAQFRQLYLEVENQLKGEKEKSKNLEIQLKDLIKKNDDLKSEIEGVRIAAQFSNESKQEEMQSLKNSHQGEIASIQHIYNEHAKENQSRLANQYEEERNKLLETITQLEQKAKQLETKKTSISNAFGIKNSAAGELQKQQQQQKEEPTLDISQKQVQQDVEGWKSIVDPLEKENTVLKQQLEECGKKVMSLEKDEIQEKLRKMKKTIDCERSARTDLEMYVNVLNTQKGVLQEDSDKLKRELHNVCYLFETEKMSHVELKQTWKLANEQFLSQQTKLVTELDRTKKILTPQQLEQLSREMRQERASNPSPIQTIPEHPYQATPGDSRKTSTPLQESRKPASGDVLMNFDPLVSATTAIKGTSSGVNTGATSKDTLLKQSKKRTPKLNKKEQPEDKQKLSDTLLSTFFPAAAQARQFNELIMKQDASMSEKPLVLSSSSEDSDDDDDLVQAINKQNENRYNVEAGVEIDEADEANAFHVHHKQKGSVNTGETAKKASLKKSSSSGDILNPNISGLILQEKTLSHGDVSGSPTSSVASNNFTDEVDSNLSGIGWSAFSDNYYNHTCMMCQNYEKQLQRLQKDYITIKDNEQKLINNVKGLRDNLDAEKEKFSSLEKSIDTVNIDTKSQINIYNTNQQEVDKQVKLLHTQFKQFRDDIVKELKSLSEDRDKAVAQYTSLHQECEEKSKNTESRLSPEDEEQLKTEIMFLKDRVMAEQVDRESTENVLQQDLEDAKQQITKLKTELENQQSNDATENALVNF